MLRSLSRRLISTIELTSDVPPSLCLPLKSETYKFSLSNSKTISQLVSEIKGEGASVVKIFTETDEELPDSLGCEYLTSHRFKIRVDNKKIEVLPGLSQFITGNEYYYSKCRKAGIPFNEARSICMFISHLQANLKTEEDYKNLKDKVDKAYNYVFSNKQQERQLLTGQLDSYEGELRSLQKQKAKLEKSANRHAGRLCLFGFGTMLLQWGGIYYGTFVMYGWDVMEPISYMVGASWGVLAYVYFMRVKQEFGLSSFKSIIAEKRLRKLMKRKKFDSERMRLLENNIDILKRKIEQVRNIN